MKWFTRDFLTGGLDDAEWQGRIDDHEQHMIEIASRLNNGAELLTSPMNLHDAQLRGWSHSPDSFRLRLLIGDLEVGYEWANLTCARRLSLARLRRKWARGQKKAYEIGAERGHVSPGQTGSSTARSISGLRASLLFGSRHSSLIAALQHIGIA